MPSAPVAFGSELHGRQNRRAFRLHGLERLRIETESHPRSVGAICADSTGAVTVDGRNKGFESNSITFVSSCEKPPCSASFLALPEYVTPPFGATMILGARGSLPGGRPGALNICVIPRPRKIWPMPAMFHFADRSIREFDLAQERRRRSSLRVFVPALQRQRLGWTLARSPRFRVLKREPSDGQELIAPELAEISRTGNLTPRRRSLKVGPVEKERP